MIKRCLLYAKGLPLVAIALLELTMMPRAAADIGLQGSYAGIPVDVDAVLRNSRAIVPTPENLTQVVVNQALQSAGATRSNLTGVKTGAIGAQFQGRYDLPNSPLSVRGSVYLGDNARAVMPIVTYDIPVGNGTNVYAGAGVSVVNGTRTTPLGDRTGMVMTTGVESEISKGLVLYGDAKWLSGNKGNNRGAGNPPIRYQLGLGYRF